jgi:chromosome segregation ATPase
MTNLTDRLQKGVTKVDNNVYAIACDKEDLDRLIKAVGENAELRRQVDELTTQNSGLLQDYFAKDREVTKYLCLSVEIQDKLDKSQLKIIDQQLKLQTRDLELDGLKDTLQIAINNGDNWQESWRKAKDKFAAREAELSLVKFKLDSLADMYKDIRHNNELLKMALKAANSKSLEDYSPYYAYDPDQDVEQLKSLCNGVIVHIPVDWLTELLADRDKSNA